MIILGIDPGTSRIGWGVIRIGHSPPNHIAHGCIEPKKQLSQTDKLLEIHSSINTLLSTHVPDVVSIEELFFSTNAKTAISVGEARGVILFTVAQRKIPTASYTPLVVKQSITGYGKAEKKQIQHMVSKLLHLPHIPTPDDAADALALALTHAYSYKLKDAYDRLANRNHSK